MLLFKKKYDLKKIDDDIYKKNRLKRHTTLLFGIFLLSVAFNVFLLPNSIVFGGVSGLSIIMKCFFGWNPSIFIFVSSVLLLIVSYYVLGKEKTKRSILGSLLFPAMVALTEGLTNYIKVDSSGLVMSALFGGVLYGIGAGLVFKAGFTTGGTDIINQILSKYFKISMGTSLIFSDGFIVLSGAFVFGPIKFMYSLVVLYLISFFTDKVLLGISDSKAFYIISEKEDEIKEYILKELGHGITVFDGKGGYTKEKQKVLFCVIPTKDHFRLKEGIYNIDNDAFFVATDAYEVLGGERNESRRFVV